MKKIIPFVAIIIVIAGGAFYGGMKYGESKVSPSNFSRQGLQDLSEEDRQQLFQGNIGESLRGGTAREAGAGFLNGEVIDKDEQSLTLRTMDGSSKIIFFSGSTEISKTAEGLVSDIEIGKQITISGEQNSDGSYTAKTIQLSSPFLMMRDSEQ